MAGLYKEIRGALQTRLLTVVGIPTVTFEGVLFRPVRETPFVECAVVPGSGRQATIGSVPFIKHEGTFEVAVSYPTGHGTETAEDMADKIKEAFRTDVTLTSGTTSIRIIYSERRQILMEPDWIRIPISVSWYVYSTNY